MNFKFEKFGETGLLIFYDEQLTRRSIQKLNELLTVAMTNVNHLIISFREVKKIDSTIIEKICQAQRNFTQLKKRITLSDLYPAAVLS